MNRKSNIVIPVLLAGLIAGCGGGGSTTATSNGTGSLLATSTAVATSWNSVKWGGGGYVTGLIYHPTTANLLYARTDVGGAYRWNSTTSSWTPITDGLGFGAAESRFHGVESLAVDPNNDQLVYMVTGMYTFEGNGRIYVSSDRGTTWTHYDLPFPVGGNNPGRAMGERLMVDPNQPSTLYYGSRTAGLWKSTDSGKTWAQVTSLSSATMTQDQVNKLGGSAMGVETIVFDTSTKGTGTATPTIYTAIAPDYAAVAGLTSNMYKSTDGGSTWTPVVTPAPGFHIPHMVRAADGMFYVVFNKDAGPGAAGPGYLYKFDPGTGAYANPGAGASTGGTSLSTGSGVTAPIWTLLKSEVPAQWVNFGMGGISVSGSGATTRIALGVTNSWGNYSGQQIVQLSDDGGKTWREIEAMNPGETASGWVDDVEIDPSNPDHIMHIHGGGILETWDASSATPTWHGAINGIEETATLALVTPPAGAPYKFVNSSGDVGTWVETDLTKTPTLSPNLGWSNGNSADMAWSDPLYIASVGVVLSTGSVYGSWSGDGGKTWANFATLPAGASANPGAESNIAVIARNNVIWAPSNSVPSWTTDNGATWTATDLPALASVGINRGYRVVADRKNPNKVYAYDSGGAWWNQWSDTAHFWLSIDGGHTFAESATFKATSPMVTSFSNVSVAVNPNVEGDVWLADGNTVYHSTDSGVTWKKLSNFASIFGSNAWPDVQGATAVALGKAMKGAKYSAAVYVVGVVNGVWGVYRSDDGGTTWTRFNDDAHQFGGIGVMAADWNTYGRIYVSGTGRGILYTN